MGSASEARDDAQVDRAIDAGSRAVDHLCNRTFQPLLATRVFDWPQEQTPRSWRLWLDQYDLITPTLILSAGAVVPETDYNLEPANSGPPYSYIETRLDRPSTWDAGETWQHSIAITGWWGYSDDQAPAGTLTASVDEAQTTVAVSDSSTVGVGDLITVGVERMTVTDKTLADTGQTLAAPLTAKKESVLTTVADGTTIHRGETITIGAERILVRDVAGNSLMVERAVDGTVLAPHDTGDTLWAPRLLTVARGAAGTTPASATSGTAIARWMPPGLVHTLAVGEAQQTLLQEQAGYARTVRSQAGTGTRSVSAVVAELEALRQRVYQAHGRQARIRVV